MDQRTPKPISHCSDVQTRRPLSDVRRTVRALIRENLLPDCDILEIWPVKVRLTIREKKMDLEAVFELDEAGRLILVKTLY